MLSCSGSCVVCSRSFSCSCTDPNERKLRMVGLALFGLAVFFDLSVGQNISNTGIPEGELPLGVLLAVRVNAHPEWGAGSSILPYDLVGFHCSCSALK